MPRDSDSRGQKYLTPTKYGTRVQIRIHGRLHRKHFPADTPPKDIEKWLLQQKLKYRHAPRRTSGRFDQDADAYLATVTAMPTYDERKRHIDEWVQVFGRRQRDSLTAAEIQTHLSTLRATLAPATVNKRRTALMHLFRTLDGKSQPNPVRDVPPYPEPKALPRAMTYQDIRKVFRAMRPSRTKARLMVIAYTGIPQKQIAALEPGDIDLKAKLVRVGGRAKGKGTVGRIVPLTKDAVTAFRLFVKLQAFGTFSNSTLGKRFRAACQRALKRKDLSPYMLRHSFGTEVYRSSGDIRAAQILLGHADQRMTHRYTLAALDPRIRDALERFGK